MEGYHFAAERQLIFHVLVNGLNRLIQFGERNNAGASTFYTPDINVACAIRRTSMFKRGVIKEFGEQAKPAPKEVEKKASPVTSQGVVTNAAPVPSKQEKAAEKADNVIEVKNFTQAKEAVSKKLGIAKSAIKTPALLARVCKEEGLEIKYIES